MVEIIFNWSFGRFNVLDWRIIGGLIRKEWSCILIRFDTEKGRIGSKLLIKVSNNWLNWESSFKHWKCKYSCVIC